MNGDRPLISLDPSANGVSYPPVLHALKITTIASAGATSIDALGAPMSPKIKSLARADNPRSGAMR
jgi:hypothetical protein